MITIRKATIEDNELIAKIGKTTFLETYLVNTPKEAVETFIQKAFDVEILTKEITSPAIDFLLMYADDKIIGYSKIVYNVPNSNIEAKNITKLDRLYVLKAYHGQKVGLELFNAIIVYSKKQQQQGIWLYVWFENKRAINFYTKNNFNIVGYYDFVLSETRSNPNHVMYLEYQFEL